MSEPIQSISQGNYILATQQEVSHDNTLSGNGTSASPLGLNETVIFSGDISNYTALSGSITASENLKNFESIRIDYTMEKTTPGWAPIETRQFTMNQHGIADNSFYLNLNSLFAVTNNTCVERFSKATINDNVLTIDFDCQRVNAGALEDQAGMCHILGITGINHK